MLDEMNFRNEEARLAAQEREAEAARLERLAAQERLPEPEEEERLPEPEEKEQLTEGFYFVAVIVCRDVVPSADVVPDLEIWDSLRDEWIPYVMNGSS